MKTNFFSIGKIYIVGCGGIGTQLSTPLLKFLRSRDDYNTVIINFVDGDKYDLGNLSRQDFPKTLTSYNKAEVMKTKYDHKSYFNGDLSIEAKQKYIDDSFILPGNSVVFGCVDNHHARRLLSDAAKCANPVCLISGGNEMDDGNVQAYWKYGEQEGRRITDGHPEIKLGSDDRSKMSCQELSETLGGGQTVFANMTAAAIMLNFFYGLFFANVEDMQRVNEVYFDVSKAKTKRVVDGVAE